MKSRYIAILLIALALPAAAMAQGFLIPTDRSVQPLSIQYQRVEIDIREQMAVTRVEQAFANHTGRVLEATYIFPVPEGATVADFEMTVNGRTVHGEILERDRARQIYQDIVRRMRDPGLLEHLGDNLFQASVFPIQPGSSQKIAITLHQIVGCDAGICSYVYPLDSGRRAGRTDEDFTLTARIRSATPIRSVYSPTHEIAVSREDDHRATAGIEHENFLLDRDFELIYTLSSQDIALSLLSSNPEGQDGFFLLLVSPGVQAAVDAMPKDITFVIDTSGSMAGGKLVHAQNALRFCLANLSPEDRFNIVRFSSDVSRMSETLLFAAPENIRQANRFVDSLRAIGGTNIDEALGMALAIHEDPGERPHMIVFLTDGLPTVGERDVRTIAQRAVEHNRRGSRIFAFGIGDRVNTNLLDSLARDNGGVSRYVRPDQEIELAVSSFYAKVARPVMSGLEMDFGGSRAYDIYPPRLPDLFAGDQLVILGRYRRAGDHVVSLSGTYKNARQTVENEVAFRGEEDDRHFIERMWATRKVGYLLEQIRLNGEDAELVDEIVSLSTKYGIVTPHTSYLIVEEEAAAPAPVFDGATRRDRRHTPPSSAVSESNEQAAGAGGERRREADSLIRGFHAQIGAEAVETSRRLSRMREGVVLEDSSVSTVRYEAGRTFALQDGVWTDSAYEEGFEVLRIRYLSDAYFDLLDRRPDLARVFAMGEKILVVTGNRKAVLVSDQGKDAVERREMERYLE